MSVIISFYFLFAVIRRIKLHIYINIARRVVYMRMTGDGWAKFMAQLVTRPGDSGRIIQQ